MMKRAAPALGPPISGPGANGDTGSACDADQEVRISGELRLLIDEQRNIQTSHKALQSELGELCENVTKLRPPVTSRVAVPRPVIGSSRSTTAVSIFLEEFDQLVLDMGSSLEELRSLR